MFVQPRQFLLEGFDQFRHAGFGHHREVRAADLRHTDLTADVLDRYERQRRHVALQHTQAQTMRNKKLLTEKDTAVRARNHDELRRTAEDPTRARAFLLRSSLIESLREAEAIA